MAQPEICVWNPSFLSCIINRAGRKIHCVRLAITTAINRKINQALALLDDIFDTRPEGHLSRVANSV